MSINILIINKPYKHKKKQLKLPNNQAKYEIHKFQSINCGLKILSINSDSSN